MNIREALYAGDGRVIRGVTPWITGRMGLPDIRRVVIVGAGVHTHQLDAVLTDRDGDTLPITIPYRVCNPTCGGADVVRAFYDEWCALRIRVKGWTMRIETASMIELRTGKSMPLRMFVQWIEPLWN